MSDKVSKFLKSLDKKMKQRLKLELIEIKSGNFDNKDIKKMVGWGKDVYRLRVGKIRIVFQQLPDRVDVFDIDFRGNIY